MIIDDSASSNNDVKVRGNQNKRRKKETSLTYKLNECTADGFRGTDLKDKKLFAY